MNIKEVEQIFTDELYQLPKRVVVLIPDSWESLAKEQVVQLEKILGYVKLNMNAVQVLSYSEVEIATLKLHNPSIILSFGTSLVPPVLRYELRQVNGMKIIYSESLGAIGDTEKRSLMTALKQAFKF